MATDGRYPPGHEEESAFDAFLDDLVQGNEDTRGRDARRADPALVESARRFHALALTRGAPALDSDARASIWEEIMGQDQTTALGSIAPGHPLASGSPRPPGTVSTRPAHRPRWPVTELAVAAVVLLIIVTGYAAWRGEQGPPTAAILAVTTPGSATASTCAITPRTNVDLTELTGTPTTRTLLPAPSFSPAARSTMPIVLPDGAVPADQAIIAGITRTVNEFAACQNADDDGRLLALYSDDYFRRAYQAGWRPTPDVATGIPVAEIGSRLPDPPSVSGVQVLPDGRVSALVTFRYAEATEYTPAVQTVVTIFQQSESRWLIDEQTLVPSTEGTASPSKTASATPETGFIVPDGDECAVEPRSFASIIALSATPSATTPAAPSFDVSSLPVGETASAETVAAVTATVRQLYACLAAGDEFRAYALFTDQTLGQLLQRDLSAPEALVTGLGPREAFDVEEVRMLSDGRVAAKIAFRVPVGVFSETWIFMWQDGRCLLDGLVRQDGGYLLDDLPPLVEATPVEGTPAA